MIKINRKGFTMIELLATIVILGILLSLSVSTILRTIERGRNKTYIADASNMVAQAEYLAKSNPAEIGMPSEGYCIVIFLSKFNSEDFDNGPNGGFYDEDRSFVVYKKNGGKNEFLGMLLEKMKSGDYKGVQLTTGVNLSKGKGEIISNPNINYDSDDAIKNYINSRFPSSPCNNIEIKRD